MEQIDKYVWWKIIEKCEKSDSLSISRTNRRFFHNICNEHFYEKMIKLHFPHFNFYNFNKNHYKIHKQLYAQLLIFERKIKSLKLSHPYHYKYSHDLFAVMQNNHVFTEQRILSNIKMNMKNQYELLDLCGSDYQSLLSFSLKHNESSLIEYSISCMKLLNIPFSLKILDTAIEHTQPKHINTLCKIIPDYCLKDIKDLRDYAGKAFHLHKYESCKVLIQNLMELKAGRLFTRLMLGLLNLIRVAIDVDNIEHLEIVTMIASYFNGIPDNLEEKEDYHRILGKLETRNYKLFLYLINL